MSGPVKNEITDGRGKSRRRFLQQLATTTAVVTAAARLPAVAQQNAQQAEAKRETSDVGSVAETLANFAVNLHYEGLPADVVRTAKRAILDAVGCAIGSYQAGPSQIAVKLAASVTARQGATVFCSGIKSSHDLATFANGVMIRYLDFNDGYITPMGGGHPSDTIASLLSSAEVGGRGGRDLVVATVVAYEVFCKLADVLDTKRLGLDQATILGPASLVGASRLMGLTKEQIVHAIGITVGGNTAIDRGRRGTLSNWKDFACAEASRKAIFSAQLAQAGMTGPSQVFEGQLGFFDVIHHKPFKLPKLGEPFGIMRAFTKRFPLGQYSQTVAEAAMEVRRFFANVDEIQEINLRVSRNAIRTMATGPEPWRPESHETADHSMPYAVGIVLLYGTIDDRFYDDPYLHDQRLLDLVSRVHCFPSDEADLHEKEYNLCDLEVILKSGQRKSVRVDYHRGHWKNPMTDAEMEEKFRSLARRHLSAEKVDALLRHLWTLEDISNVGTLVEMTKV